MDLFFDEEAFQWQESLENAMLDIRRRFGKSAITFAGLMLNTKLPAGRIDEEFVLPNVIYQ